MTDFRSSGPYSAKDRVIDELLVVHIMRGDQRALDRLGRRWEGRLFRVAHHLTGHTELAEIAAQEAWIGICRGWLRLKSPSSFSPWAFGILKRKCLDAIRQKTRRNGRVTSLEVTGEISIPARGENRASLLQAFGALSPDHHDAAILFFVEGLMLSEVAILTGVPIGTAKSRIFHARRQLKAHLTGETND